MTFNPGTVMGGFRLLSWLFPLAPLEELTAESYEELAVRYRIRDRWTNWLGVPVFLLLAAIFSLVLIWLAHRALGDIRTAKFLIRHIDLEYALLGVFMSLFSFGFLFFSVCRWVWGPEEFALYNASCSRRAFPVAPLDIYKAYRLFFLVPFPLLLAVAALMLDHSTAFTESSLIDNPLLSLGTKTVHPYQTVRGIAFVRMHHARFEDIVHPRFVVTFADGTQWESERIAGDPPAGPAVDAMRYVAERTSRPIARVKFPEDAPHGGP